MAARAMWKGVLRLGSVKLPLKLHAALEDRSIRFHLLHAKDKVRVEQRMVSSATGREVPREEVRKGYDVEPGVFVFLDDDELKTLEPKDSRDIEVTQFVKRGAIDPAWFERPYYLSPDGEEHADTYLALVEALSKDDWNGVVRWTMRGKSYRGALRAERERLMVVTMRPAGEVISASEVGVAPGREPDAKELKMAEQLVAALEGEFDPSEWRDTYRDRVMALVRTKARGGRVKATKFERKPAATDLAAMLEASLRRAKKKAS